MKKVGKIAIVLVLLCGVVFCAKEVLTHSSEQSGEEALTGQNVPGTKTDEQHVKRKKADSAILIQVEDVATLEDGVFTFGQITFTMPEEGEVENIVLENGVQTTCLRSVSAEYEFPREIYFRHYTADWQDKSEYVLIDSLMELIGTDKVLCRHMDLDKGEMGLWLDTEYMEYHIFVREEDIYVVGQMFSYGAFNFEMWVYDDILYWNDTKDKVNMYEEDNLQYAKVEQPDGKVLFLAGEEYCLKVFEDGHFGEPVQELKSVEGNGVMRLCEDINFDGYRDIYWWDGEQQFCLYNPQNGMFEKANCRQVIDNYYTYDLVKYPEQQTIWSGKKDYQNEYPFELETETEGLWKWEGNSLVLKKECKLVCGDETVFLTAQEGETVLFEVTVNKEEWKQDENLLKGYYEQFYEGYVPNEAYHLAHEAAGDKEYIPQGLVEILIEAMKNGNELEVLEPMVGDKELTGEERLEKILSNDSIRCTVEEISRIGSCFMVMSDGDNDGIADIGIEVYSGGTGGFTEFVFFKGQADGTYVRTSIYSHVMEEFAFITYEGKQYLCRTVFDYNKKQYDGFDLYYYENGKRVENVWLELVPQEYEVVITNEPQGVYAAYVEENLSPEKCLEYHATVEEFDAITGNAEKDKWICDLNNDGVAEEYNKYIWTPSNMGTYACLTFDCETLPEAEDMMYYGETEGVPMMMWVDSVEGKNIVNVLYRTDLYEFLIVGYLMEGTEYEKLYCIEGTTEYGVSEQRTFIYEGENAGF